MKTTVLFSKFNYVLLALIIVLGSCSKNNQTAFHKRKYQPFFVKTKGAKVDKPKELEMAASDVFVEVETKQNQVRSEVTSQVDETVSNSQEPISSNSESKSKASKVRLTEKVLVNHFVKKNLQTSEVTQQQKAELDRLLNEFSSESSEEEDIRLILLLILCVLLPPLAVFILYGFSGEFWLSVLLTIFFWLPGIIFAAYLVIKDAGEI